MANNKDRITVTISGPSNSGKTTLAAALRDFLVLRGIYVEDVLDEDLDAYPQTPEVNAKCTAAVAQKTVVVIETKQTRRAPFQAKR